MFFLCLALYACGAGTSIEFKPDISGVKDPILVIKDILEEQPAAYAYVPSDVEVNDQYLAFGLASGHRSPGTFTRLYYKRIGEIRLSKSLRYPTYEVNIYEKSGDHAAIVVTMEEKRATDFINALHYMVTQTADMSILGARDLRPIRLGPEKPFLHGILILCLIENQVDEGWVVPYLSLYKGKGLVCELDNFPTCDLLFHFPLLSHS
jgi:hypothetical protein